MPTICTLYHMILADFYQRVRSYRFLAMLLFTIILHPYITYLIWIL